MLKKKAHELTDEELARSIKEIERSMKNWPKSQDSSEHNTGAAKAGLDIPSMIQVLGLVIVVIILIMRLL